MDRRLLRDLLLWWWELGMWVWQHLRIIVFDADGKLWLEARFSFARALARLRLLVLGEDDNWLRPFVRLDSVLIGEFLELLEQRWLLFDLLSELE